MIGAVLHDVGDDEEVAGEALLLDDPELVLDHLERPRRAHPVAVAQRGPHPRQPAQPARLGLALGHRERGQLGRQQVEGERALATQLRGAGDGLRVAGEALGHLRPGAQVGRPRRQPALGVVEAAPRPHRRQRGREPGAVGGGVVRAGGGHRAQAAPPVGPRGEPRQRRVALGVVREALVGELDRDVLGAEQGDETVELAGGADRPLRGQRPAHRPLAAPRQHLDVPAERRRDPLGVVDRAPLLPVGVHLPLGDRARDRPVAVGVAGEDQQVVALGIGHAVLRRGQAQRELGAVDRRHPQLLRGLGEADHAVHAVVVGERDRLQPQPRGLLDQLLGVRRAVEEAEVGVHVQLGVGDGDARRARPRRRPVGRAVPRPRRAVAPVAREVLVARRAERAGAVDPLAVVEGQGIADPAVLRPVLRRPGAEVTLVRLAVPPGRAPLRRVALDRLARPVAPPLQTGPVGGAPRQQALHLRPAHRRVAPPHVRSLPRRWPGSPALRVRQS